MIKIERLASPDILVEKFDAKTLTFVANPNQKVFDCRTRLYKRIKERLMLMTQSHCSFCDGFPISNTGDAIEHFRPSSAHPELAYQWENLYYICPKCNGAKGNRFHNALLRPDEAAYFFEHFFDYNAREAKLEPAKNISDEDVLRAKETIKHYDLNRSENISERRRFIKIFINGTHERDDFPFRYIIDLGLI